MQEPYHYTLIARAIAEIDASPEPLSLEALSARLGLSPAHFQRVFSAWAGVSPKRFQQYLTLGHAKALLADGAPLLEVSAQTGLSGPSRLHDLFITWDAMTPGSWAAKGRGLTLGEATCDSPFGPMVAYATERGLCGLGFAAEMGVASTRADLRARWPEARFTQDAGVATLAQRALAGHGALHVMGAPFQIKVWQALLEIPEGRATSYGKIAAQLDQPGAARAVGTAVGRNPISAIIPCHRVLRQTGALGGYHWGLPIKRALLAREAARAANG